MNAFMSQRQIIEKIIASIGTDETFRQIADASDNAGSQDYIFSRDELDDRLAGMTPTEIIDLMPDNQGLRYNANYYRIDDRGSIHAYDEREAIAYISDASNVNDYIISQVLKSI